MVEALTERIFKTVLKAPIHLYRWTLKPLAGHHCRHWPSCSQYALDAIETNGAWRGFWLMLSAWLGAVPAALMALTPRPTSVPSITPSRPGAMGVGGTSMIRKPPVLTRSAANSKVTADAMCFGSRLLVFRDGQ